jgi:hypothetical protein
MSIYTKTNNGWTEIGASESGSDPQGLVHINTTTFSAVTSVIVNGCFSVTYDNYLIMIQGVSDRNSNLEARFRVSGTDATTNYAWRHFRVADSSSIETSAEGLSAKFGSVSTSHGFATSVNLFSPAKAERTNFYSTNWYGANTEVQVTAGVHKTATAYDGITIFPTNDTFTGTIRVYGYKDGA